MKAKELRKFGTKFARLFHTNKYKRYAEELDIKVFHAGGCRMVALALNQALGGQIWAVAEYDPQSDDWPLHHYILRVGQLFIDNTGVYRGHEVPAIRGSNLRLAPVLSPWPNGGLWEGDHAFDQRIYDAMVKDVKAILAQP